MFIEVCFWFINQLLGRTLLLGVRTLAYCSRKLKNLTNGEYLPDGDSNLLIFLWGSIDRCPSLLLDVYASIYFDHYLLLMPSIGQLHKKSGTSNFKNSIPMIQLTNKFSF